MRLDNKQTKKIETIIDRINNPLEANTWLSDLYLNGIEYINSKLSGIKSVKRIVVKRV
jgi:hypothetical protein